MQAMTPGFIITHDIRRICVWFVCMGLAVAVQTAQSEEISFKLVNSGEYGQSVSRFGVSIEYGLGAGTVSADAEYGGASRSFVFAGLGKTEYWSTSLQQQTATNEDCSSLSSLLCLDSKEQQPDLKLQRDSFWGVLRKALHF